MRTAAIRASQKGKYSTTRVCFQSASLMTGVEIERLWVAQLQVALSRDWVTKGRL